MSAPLNELQAFRKLAALPGEAFDVPGFGACTREALEGREVWWDEELQRWRLAPGCRFIDRNFVTSTCKREPFPTTEKSAEVA